MLYFDSHKCSTGSNMQQPVRGTVYMYDGNENGHSYYYCNLQVYILLYTALVRWSCSTLAVGSHGAFVASHGELRSPSRRGTVVTHERRRATR